MTNFVWICTDQQRSDSLGCAGNEQAHTPHLDALARDGTRFTRHVTPMQICSPSRATMFTGLYPRHHELIVNGMALHPDIPTLPAMLAHAGYRTHGVGKQHLQPLLAPVERGMPDSRAFWGTLEADGWTGPYYGFETVDLLLGESDTAAIAGHYARWLREQHPQAVELLEVAAADPPPPGDLDEIWCSAIPVELHYNSWITDHAVRFLDGAGADTPFFLFVSYPDPHHPFAPPGAYADRFDPREMPLPRADEGELDRLPPYYRDLYPTGGGFREMYWQAHTDQEAGAMITTSHISDASMRLAIAHTHAMVEMIDDGVGRILASLEASGRRDDTVVLFTSDHGELLGTHGLLHKGPPSYRQLTEVSLLMQGPGVAAGRAVNALTNHIDLTPTILDMAGVAPDASFDGRSMSALVNGGDGWRREASFGEYHPTVRGELYNQTVRTDRWRLSRYPSKPEWGELFDHSVDGEEHFNLYHEDSASAARRELTDLLEREFPPQPTVDNEVLCKW